MSISARLHLDLLANNSDNLFLFPANIIYIYVYTGCSVALAQSRTIFRKNISRKNDWRIHRSIRYEKLKEARLHVLDWRIGEENPLEGSSQCATSGRYN